MGAGRRRGSTQTDWIPCCSSSLIDVQLRRQSSGANSSLPRQALTPMERHSSISSKWTGIGNPKGIVAVDLGVLS